MANLSVKARESSWGIVHPEVDQDVPVTGLLTADDFTYLGSFIVPQVPGGGLGLTYYPLGNGGNGSLLIPTQRLTDYPNQCVEVSIPTPVISATRDWRDLNSASTVRSAFDHTGGIFPAYFNVDPGGRKSITTAIGVVQFPDSSYKLFSAWHNWYVANDTYNIVYCDLAASGTPVVSNPRGPWSLSGVTNGLYAASVFTVPSSWASTHCGGRYIGLGGSAFGTQAGTQSGGHSAWFVAPWVDDPINANPSANGYISHVEGPHWSSSDVLNQSTNNADVIGNTSQHMKYPDSLLTLGWRPSAETNFAWNSDHNRGLQWVTTSDGRSGFVGASHIRCDWQTYGKDDGSSGDTPNDWALPQGNAGPTPRQATNGTNCYYIASSFASGYVSPRQRPALSFYDPADFVTAISGGPKYAVQPFAVKSLWEDLTLSGVYSWRRDSTGTIRRESDDAVSSVENFRYTFAFAGNWLTYGSVYDATSRRFYVIQAEGHSNTMEWIPLVHVYEVA